MGRLSKGLGIVFNILSFVLLVLSAYTGINSTPDAGGNGIGPSFAFWAYSVIFALIAMVLYTIGAIRSGRIGRSVFTIIILLLCICFGGALNSVAIFTWNIVFAINLIIQISWLIRS